MTAGEAGYLLDANVLREAGARGHLKGSIRKSGVLDTEDRKRLSRRTFVSPLRRGHPRLPDAPGVVARA